MNTKTSLSIITKSACVATLFALSATTDLKSQILYATDFDSMTSGTTIVGQDGWTNYSGDASKATIVDNAAIAYSDNNYLEIAGDGVFARVRRNFNGEPDYQITDTKHNRIQFLFQSSAFGSGLTPLSYSTRANVGVQTMAEFRINATGNAIVFSSDGSFNTTRTVSLTADTWYAVDIYLRPSTYEYDFSLVNTSDSSVVLSETFSFGTTGVLSEYFYTNFFYNSAAAGSDWRIDNLSISSIPEPSSIALLGLGGLAAFARRRIKKA
ncbi:MAG: PEP-CTERM sorting domain-containing protein [Chthoniobacterales bacterium]